MKMKTLPSACLRPILTIFWNRTHKKKPIDSNVSIFENRKKWKIIPPYCPRGTEISAVNASGETQHRWSQQMRKNVDKSMWR